MNRTLEIELFKQTGKPLKLKNPLLLASGTCGYAIELNDFTDLTVPGAFISKGTTLHAREGNPQPRIAEVKNGMLNAIGLENIGTNALVTEKAPAWQKMGLTVFVNIAGSTIDEYAEIAMRLEGVEGIAGIEINISCPNVQAGGVEFGLKPETATAVTSAVRKKTTLPIIVKLSPGSGRTGEIAQATASAGADAVTLINTFKGMVIDIGKRRPLLGNITGGLSGPALKPVALSMVYEAAGLIDIPIIACGGISSAEDAIEFLMAGASAFQVGTAFMTEPSLPSKILSEIYKFFSEQNINNVEEIRGCARTR
ncbi:MAG: dihydroorotate dehydrogenase [Dehalococcoidales bacterium]|nr:dihydroorotate dehydrogenase [Dehalococcoidales bacterium]